MSGSNASGEYQLCPKCNGDRLLWQEVGMACADDAILPSLCHICDGKGIIQGPVMVDDGNTPPNPAMRPHLEAIV